MNKKCPVCKKRVTKKQSHSIISGKRYHMKCGYDFDCEGCKHFEFGWGACEFEQDWTAYKEMNIPLPWKPHYKGKECERYTKVKSQR